jgi:hypothetical protein
MKTELYKMWLDFCKDKNFGLNRETMLDDGTIIGYAYFSYKSGKEIKMANPSPEYDAWRAFMQIKDCMEVTKFIVKNFDLLKEWFPAAAVFLDLHQLEAAELLDTANRSVLIDFHKAVYQDAYLIDQRKRRHV